MEEESGKRKVDRRRGRERLSVDLSGLLSTALASCFLPGRQKSGEDKTPIELFVAGLTGWEADLRRHFAGK